MVLFPAAAYIILHVLGYYYPARLWGVDQFYYYPQPLLAAFVMAALAVWLLAARYAFTVDGLLKRLLGHFDRMPFGGYGRAGILLLCFLAAAWILRVRGHYLGDSSMWFANMEILLQGRAESIGWITGLPVAGLEYVPAHQGLDFLLHYHLYRLVHALWGATPADAYSWLSLLAGIPYLAVLWQLARRLSATMRDRVTCFALLLTLGTLQFFCGYGESYTLLNLMAALYALQGLRLVWGETTLWSPTLCLLGAVALHLMAIALLPSFMYLLWRDPGRVGNALRQPHLHRPLLAAGAALALYVYVAFYRFHHLSLWQVQVDGRYPLLSIAHVGNLFNELLLISPFGLVWGLVSRPRRQRPDASVRFAFWGALGPGALVGVHDAVLGGRDWDLMALPGLFLALWGLLRLGQSPQTEHWLRQARLLVVPLMAAHTILWIGVNANHQRSIDRLGNLLLHTPNQPRHYQAFTLGHYYLNLRQDNHDKAVRYLRQALALAPDADTERRYAHYLARALLNLGVERKAQGAATAAIGAFAEAAQLQPDYAKAHYNLGVIYVSQGEYRLAAESYEAAMPLDPENPQLLYNIGAVYNRLGRHREAVAAYQLKLRLLVHGAEDAETLYNLGMSHFLLGEREAARRQYERLKTLDADLATQLLQRF